MQYSLTFGGLLVGIVGPLLIEWGFTESCANEVTSLAMPVVGLLMAWIGRVRAGGVNWWGKKTA